MVTARLHDGSLTVAIGDDSVTIAQLWLRDACRCGECRHPHDLRRITEALSVPLDTAATGVSVDDDDITIAWSDGHQSQFSAAWLQRRGRPLPPIDLTGGRPTWSTGQTVTTYQFDALMTSAAAVAEWLDTIVSVGFALVVNTPRTRRRALHDITNLIGPVRPSNYGVDWDIEASVAPKNAVFSAVGLSPHTDLPYRELPPGLQLLLSDVADAPGGASTLVDGYHLAEHFRAEHPDDFELLTTEPVRFSYVDDEHDLRYAAPVIGRNGTGQYSVIRHAPGLMGSLSPDPDDFVPLYRALHRFTAMTNDQANQVVHRLVPGELLCFDNHRLLHGRTAFDLGAGGRRHLLGSYADLDDLRSQARRLGTSFN